MSSSITPRKVVLVGNPNVSSYPGTSDAVSRSYCDTGGVRPEVLAPRGCTRCC